MEGAARVRTGIELWRERPVNRYLLCAVLSKQARRLGRLIPELGVGELIGVALRNCTEHRVEIQLDRNTPDAIREEATRIFPPVKRSEACIVFARAQLEWSQVEIESRPLVSTLKRRTGKLKDPALLRSDTDTNEVMVSILLILVTICPAFRRNIR